MAERLGDEHSCFDSPIDVAGSDAELNDASQYVEVDILGIAAADKNTLSIMGIFPGSPAEHRYL